MRQLVFHCLAVSMVTAWNITTGSWSADTSNVRVEVMNTSSSPPLETFQISPTSGYIQTPGWGNASRHPKHMDSVVRVTVPEDCVAMFTMLHLNLTGKRLLCDESQVTLVLYKTGMSPANTVWYCGRETRVPLRRLSFGSDLYVHFQSGKIPKLGFQLYFSVHKELALIQAGSADSWNCSMPNFADFKPHFPCDLYPQCVDKEDERDCPYFSEECGLGFVTLGSHCLLYVKSKRSSTWRDMNYKCERQRMKLVNFRRREDYDRLVLYLETLAAVWGFRKIAVGIHSSSTYLPLMYTKEMENSDGTIAFYSWIDKKYTLKSSCGAIYFNRGTEDYVDHIRIGHCTKLASDFAALCEIPKLSVAKHSHPTKIQVRLMSASNYSHLPVLDCPLGHVTRDFLACDFDSACWVADDRSCLAPLAPHPPSFICSYGVERVPFTLVCDLRSDCKDDSDESFCQFPPCDLPDPFHCSDRECVSWTTVCDGLDHCHNAADEDLCSVKTKGYITRPSPPAIVHLNRQGQFVVHKMTQSQLADLSPAVCPETHFSCPDNGYCMPVFLRCNGVYDCLGKEDEVDCDSYACPGFYRCRHSQVCVHPEHLCDDIFQCPQHDDELLCDLICPENCTCYGLAFFCLQPFPAKNFKQLRFLDGRASGIKLGDLKVNVMLIHLSIPASRLTSIGELHFPNLLSLDLSDNQLREIQLQDLICLSQLETLSLSGNPLSYLFQHIIGPEKPDGIHQSLFYPVGVSSIGTSSPDVRKSAKVMTSVRTLDMFHVKANTLNTSFLSLLPNLHTVNMSGGGVDTLLGEGFQALTQLRALDLRGCPLTYFPRDIFRDLEQLETVYSDNYKLCCAATLPASFVLKNCHAPSDKVSSCEALLKSNSYRIFVSVFASLSLLGNVSMFIYHVFVKGKWITGVEVFVTHLSLADFLMGVYLTVIGVADRLKQGTYLWEDNTWRKSSTCKISGFLSLVSSEVSALIICLITVERLLVLRFPFSSFNFGVRSAQIASLCMWGLGCLIAALPLAPGVSHWEFYGQTAICVPLPLDRTGSVGYSYMFGSIIVANFIFFTVVGAGLQVFIYWSVQSSSLLSMDKTKTFQDLVVAQRFITVAISDFLCWFPIGLLGILVITGTPISDEVSVAMAVFVLPFNSALNPILYTLNIILEKRRLAYEERVKKRLMALMGTGGKNASVKQSFAQHTTVPV